MSSLLTILLVAGAAVFLFGCQAERKVPDLSDRFEGVKAQSQVYWPRVDGSTATIPMTTALYAAYFKVTPEEAKAAISHNKTHEAIINVIKNGADIAFVTHPSIEELNEAKSYSVDLRIVPIAREGFVFLVNSDNPVSSLSIPQLREIYRHEHNNWGALGGLADMPLKAFSRPENSGSQTLFQKFIMPQNEIVLSKESEVIEYEEIMGMGELIEEVANTKLVKSEGVEEEQNDEDTGSASSNSGGIGYSVYYYATEMKKNPKIKLLAVEGVYPSRESLLSGRYPFYDHYYAVFKANNTPASVTHLLEYIYSDQGQKVLSDAGYIPYSEAVLR